MKMYMVDTTRPVAYVTIMSTEEYCSHYHGYIVKRTSSTAVIPIQNLHSPFPLHVRSLANKYQLVVMKHFISGTVCA